jgi:hypothetical protein
MFLLHNCRRVFLIDSTTNLKKSFICFQYSHITQKPTGEKIKRLVDAFKQGKDKAQVAEV